MSLGRTLAVAAAVFAVLAPAASAGVRVFSVDEPLVSVRTLESGARVAPPRAAPHRFDLVGLHWRGPGSVWFRTRPADGAWSAWQPARPEGEDLPDVRSREGRARRGWTLGNPYWTGAASEIQYRLNGRVTRLRAWFLWSPLRPLRKLTIAGTPSIIPRSSWGADESIVRAKPLYADRIQLAIVHHTAGRAPSSPEESAAMVAAIQVYHVKANGWNDIGYNFVVDPFGQVFEGRAGGVDRNVVGAHALGFNTGSVGIAVLGTYDDGPVTPEAESAVEALIAWRLDLAHVDPITLVTKLSSGNPRFPSGIPVTLTAVSGHRNTGFTDCPGEALYGQIGEIAQGAAAIGLPKLYEPVVEGSVGGLVQFSARLSDALPWTVTVTDALGNVVASGSGTDQAVSWTWDATAAPPGAYAYRIDGGPGALPAVGTLGGAIGLDVTKLAAAPTAFTPNGDGSDDQTTISFSLTAAAVVSAVVLDSTGAPVVTLLPEQTLPAGPVSLSWSGALADASQAPDGTYRLVVTAHGAKKDVAKSLAVVVDRSLGGLALSGPAISPNGDGRLDSVEIGFDLVRPAEVRVRLLDAEGRSVARLFAGALPGGGRQTLSWDGHKRGGRVRDGLYAVEVETTTELGTRRLVQALAVDTKPPEVNVLSVRSRGGATKLLFDLSEPAHLKVWYGKSAFEIDRPQGKVGFWQRIVPRWVRLVAWDAAGNASERLDLAL